MMELKLNRFETLINPDKEIQPFVQRPLVLIMN